jgi:hypothetical protein
LTCSFAVEFEVSSTVFAVADSAFDEYAVDTILAFEIVFAILSVFFSDDPESHVIMVLSG